MMIRLDAILLAATLLMPAVAHAAPSLDGTWKQDMSTAKFSGKPVVISLKNDTYFCSSCVPPEKFTADGKPHKVTGQPYHDTAMATVASPTEVDLTLSKDGKTVTTQDIVVAGDGATATFKGTDSSDSNSAPVDFSFTAKRIGKAAAGSHAVFGAWVAPHGSDSDNGLTMTYKVDGDMLSMTTPTGQSYTAKLNGPQAPFKGDPGLTAVAVKKIGANIYREIDYRDGKPMFVATTTLSADGKTAKIVSEFTGQRMEVTAVKQ
jgi:hypothetical protein